MERNMSFEEVLQDPSLSRFHEMIHFMRANKDKIFFPKKFMMSLKHIMEQKLIGIHRETPDMPLIKVLITSLTGVNENIEPEMLLEITTFIIKEWEGLIVAKQQEISELQPA